MRTGSATSGLRCAINSLLTSLHATSMKNPAIIVVLARIKAKRGSADYIYICRAEGFRRTLKLNAALSISITPCAVVWSACSGGANLDWRASTPVMAKD